MKLLSTFLYKFFGGCMFSFLFGIYLGMELLSYWVESDNSSQSGCTILHIHQQCMRVPVASHLYQLLVLSVFFSFSYSGEGIVICHCGFKFVFPWLLMVLSTFSCVYLKFAYLFVRGYLRLCPFLIGLFISLFLTCRSSLHSIFRCKSFVMYVFCKYFSTIYVFLLHFRNGDF